MNSYFLYTPLSGSKMVACNPCAQVVAVKHSNGSDTIVSVAPPLHYHSGTREERGRGVGVASAIVNAVGGAAADVRGEISLWVPAHELERAQRVMGEAGLSLKFPLQGWEEGWWELNSCLLPRPSGIPWGAGNRLIQIGILDRPGKEARVVIWEEDPVNGGVRAEAKAFFLPGGAILPRKEDCPPLPFSIQEAAKDRLLAKEAEELEEEEAPLS